MAAKLEKTRTPGIYKRGSRYVFVYRVRGKQVWESCRTYDEARRAKSARQTDVERGEFSPRSRITLHEFAREWIKRYHGRGRRGFREHTRSDYERQLEQYVFRFFSERVRLTQMTPSDIARFVAWLCDPRAQAKNEHALALAKARDAGTKEPPPLPLDARRELADGTVRNILAPLRACLATAVREGVLRSNPAREVDLPHRPAVKDDEGLVKALSTEQLATFLQVVHPRHQVFFKLLAGTGLRVSEAIALRWRDVHLDGSSPHVKVRRAIVRGDIGLPKSKYGRRDVPISFELVHALRERRSMSEWPRPDDLMFSSRIGSPLAPNNLLRRVLKPAAEEAGAPWAGFHSFRHTCASMLFAQGRNAVQVQRWLGHHSAAFTLATYVHLLDGDLGAPLDVSGQALDPSGCGEQAVNIDRSFHFFPARTSSGVVSDRGSQAESQPGV